MSPLDVVAARQSDWLGWVSLLSNLVMVFVCVRIPVLLFRASRRKDLPYRLQAILIATLILCSGLSHVLYVLVFWTTSYPLLVAWNVLTAGISVLALIWLVPAIPQVVAMRTPQELEEALAKANAATARAEAAEAGLGEKVRVLENTERTLRHTNRDLQQVMAARKLLESRVRELEALHHPDQATGTTPTQAAIAKMNDAVQSVVLTLTPNPATPNSDPELDSGSVPT